MTSVLSNNLVSVIIPAYNAERYLDETIQSVINQSYHNWELIIVNDGSSDKTASITKTWTEKDKRIQCINKLNTGVSDSRNIGIENAKGEIIFFLDADDVWDPNNISEKLKRFDQNNISAIYSACELIDENTKSLTRNLQGSEDLSLKDMLLLKGNYITAPSGIAVKTNVARKIDGFDKNLSNNADQDFFIRILAGGYKIGYLNETLWKYRMHHAGMSKNVSLLEKDILFMFNKAAKNKLFESYFFKKRCFANVYITLAGSWWKNGNNKMRGIYYILKAFLSYPPSIIIYLSK